MLKILEGFHQWAARQITGITEKHVADGEWEYPLVVEALETARFHPIREYILRHQATMAAHMACCPIYGICTEADWRSGTIWMVIFWDHDMVHTSEELTENMCNLT